MPDHIDFYYDYSSTYSYLAHARLDEIESKTGKTVTQKPIVLGAIFRQLGFTMPAADSVKLNYLTLDLTRRAATLGLPFRMPEVFPFNAMECMRLFYLLQSRDAQMAEQFSTLVFEAAYTKERNMAEAKNIDRVLKLLDLDRQQLVDSDEFAVAKLKLKAVTEEAIQAEVFGAPTFIYQNERFWGEDRIDMLIATAST